MTDLQGITVLPATKHEPYVPLLPAAEYHRLLACAHCPYPRIDGQAELIWVVDTMPR